MARYLPMYTPSARGIDLQAQYIPMNLDYMQNVLTKAGDTYREKVADVAKNRELLASIPTYHPEEKQRIMDEFSKKLQEISTRYKGDLSRGAADIVGEISTVKSDPFWNANQAFVKRYQEQQALEDQLKSQGKLLPFQKMKLEDLYTDKTKDIVGPNRYKTNWEFDLQSQLNYDARKESLFNNIKADTDVEYSKMVNDPNWRGWVKKTTGETNEAKIDEYIKKELAFNRYKTTEEYTQEKRKLRVLEGVQTDEEADNIIKNSIAATGAEFKYHNLDEQRQVDPIYLENLRNANEAKEYDRRYKMQQENEKLKESLKIIAQSNVSEAGLDPYTNKYDVNVVNKTASQRIKEGTWNLLNGMTGGIFEWGVKQFGYAPPSGNFTSNAINKGLSLFNLEDDKSLIGRNASLINTISTFIPVIGAVKTLANIYSSAYNATRAIAFNPANDIYKLSNGTDEVSKKFQSDPTNKTMVDFVKSAKSPEELGMSTKQYNEFVINKINDYVQKNMSKPFKGRIIVPDRMDETKKLYLGEVDTKGNLVSSKITGKKYYTINQENNQSILDAQTFLKKNNITEKDLIKNSTPVIEVVGDSKGLGAPVVMEYNDGNGKIFQYVQSDRSIEATKTYQGINTLSSVEHDLGLNETGEVQIANKKFVGVGQVFRDDKTGLPLGKYGYAIPTTDNEGNPITYKYKSPYDNEEITSETPYEYSEKIREDLYKAYKDGDKNKIAYIEGIKYSTMIPVSQLANEVYMYGDYTGNIEMDPTYTMQGYKLSKDKKETSKNKYKSEGEVNN